MLMRSQRFPLFVRVMTFYLRRITSRYGCLRRAVMVVGALAILHMPSPANAGTFRRISTNVADALHNVLDLRPSDTTDWRLGVGPTINPDFEGSKDYRIEPAPVISLRYRDVLKVDNNEVDFTAFDQVLDLGDTVGRTRFSTGPVMNLDFGRHESDSKDLRGLGNIGMSVEFGGYVSFDFERASIEAEMSQDVANGHHGATLDLHGAIKLYKGEKLMVAPDLVVTWATARYMKSFFGITGTQSAASGLPTFRAGAGFKNASLSLLASYDIARHWSVLAHVGYTRLMGDAAASPLVRLRGAADQLTAGTFVVYVF
jgi:outer membrane scaffolding protein for murein synthesis (MipA/OmpV family)